ncbi:MAG: GlxA family transcriptional regulator [Hyphomicrobiales bacterium]
MTRTIAVLVFEGFQLLDAAGPIAAFEMAARYGVPGAYEIRLVSRSGGHIESSSGAILRTQRMALDMPVDTLVVAGGRGTRAAATCPRTLAFVRHMHGRARRVCSVCTGAYVLAAAGLLDGRSATTHWEQTADFARTFDRVHTEPDRIYTRDGDVWTSAGVTAGIDMSLALIADDLGEAVARAVARQLVVYYRRTGGQSQFSALLEETPPAGRFAPLLGWMRENIGDDLPVERLAAEAGMSPRNFARSFAREVGTSPARMVEKIRLEAAMEHVEESDAPLDVVARRIGFGDPDRMRRAFLRVYGQTPQALRRSRRLKRPDWPPTAHCPE